MNIKCLKCKEDKDAINFVKDKGSITGYYSYCKDCARKNSLKQRENNPIKWMLACVKSSAKKRGLEFNITIEDIIIPELCPYLGIEIKHTIPGLGLLDSAPSIDRIDNKKGYVKGNVIVISQQANRMKGGSSIDQLVNFAINVIKIHVHNVNPISVPSHPTT